MKIAMIGLGTVGQGVYSLYKEKRSIFEKLMGQEISFAGIAVNNLKKKRYIEIERGLLTDDYKELIAREDVDTVLDLTGLVEEAARYNKEVLLSGKNLISANKAALAYDFSSLIEAAREGGGSFRFEAAVAGGIPLLEEFSLQLMLDDIYSFEGIVNGSSNYVLSEMTKGRAKEEVLEEASRLGILEADPSDDLEGHDSSRKLTIMANMALAGPVHISDVFRIGMEKIENKDLEVFAEKNMRVKLIASFDRGDQDRSGNKETKARLRLTPLAVNDESPFFRVSDVMNKLVLKSKRQGSLSFYGPGGKMDPTANAVWSDILRSDKSTFDSKFYRSQASAGIDKDYEANFYIREIGEKKGSFTGLSLNQAKELSKSAVLILKEER